MAIPQLERQTKTDSKRVGAVAVVGGGIAGMQASLDLAESGFKVYVIESKSSIGGRMAQLDKTFPTNDCAMCTMAPRLVELGRHPNVELLTCSELKSVEGYEGNFKVRVLKKTRYVDETKCNGCGVCWNNCPAVIAPRQRIIKKGDQVIKVISGKGNHQPATGVADDNPS